MKHTCFFLFLLLWPSAAVFPAASQFSPPPAPDRASCLSCLPLSPAPASAGCTFEPSRNFVPAAVRRSYLRCGVDSSKDVRPVDNGQSRAHARTGTIGRSCGCAFLVVLALCFTVLLRRDRRLVRRLNVRLAALQEEHDELQARYRTMMECADRESEEESRLVRTLELRLQGLCRLSDKAYTQIRPATFLAAFRQYAQRIRDDETALADLRYVVNRRHAGFVDRLRRNYPRLTEAEIDLLCMLLFGFSFDSIRLLCNHDNVDSLYSRRTKIREKLDLPPGYGLEKFLSELAAAPLETSNPEPNGVP